MGGEEVMLKLKRHLKQQYSTIFLDVMVSASCGKKMGSNCKIWHSEDNNKYLFSVI